MNIYHITVYFANKRIRLKCSYKIIPISLIDLKAINSKHKKEFPDRFVTEKTIFYKGEVPDPIYWDNFENFKWFMRSEAFFFDLEKEATEDCLAGVLMIKEMLEGVIGILSKIDANVLKKFLSAPSMSYYIFLSKFNNKKIIEKLSNKDDIFIRNSYFGGRCEVFGNPRDSEHIKFFDFSGMYGQCMMEKFHIGSGEYVINENYDKPGFHSIEYSSDFEFLPVLPSHSVTGKLLFSNGDNKVGVFWYEEIKLFVKYGGKVNKVIMSYIFKETDFVFDKFVTEFNKIKEKGGYYRIVGKLMINALYGGMGLKTDDTKDIITLSEKEYLFILENFTIERETKLNSVYIIKIKKDFKYKKFFKIKENKRNKRNVSYASAVASKARIKLYEAFKEVTEDGGRLLYCDTDSIFAAYDLKDSRKTTKNIQWQKFYSDAVFIAPKSYAIKEEKDLIKIKGIKISNISFEEIKKNFYNNNKIEFKDQMLFSRNGFILETKTTIKGVSLYEYEKRVFIDNKKNTIPLKT